MLGTWGCTYLGRGMFIMDHIIMVLIVNTYIL